MNFTGIHFIKYNTILYIRFSNITGGGYQVSERCEDFSRGKLKRVMCAVSGRLWLREQWNGVIWWWIFAAVLWNHITKYIIAREKGLNASRMRVDSKNMVGMIQTRSAGQTQSVLPVTSAMIQAATASQDTFLLEDKEISQVSPRGVSTYYFRSRDVR